MVAAVSLAPVTSPEDPSLAAAVRSVPTPPVSQAEPPREGGNSTSDQQADQGPRDRLSARLQALVQGDAEAAAKADDPSASDAFSPYRPPATSPQAPQDPVVVSGEARPGEPESVARLRNGQVTSPETEEPTVKTLADEALKESLKPRDLFPLTGPANAYLAADRVDEASLPSLFA